MSRLNWPDEVKKIVQARNDERVIDQILDEFADRIGDNIEMEMGEMMDMELTG